MSLTGPIRRVPRLPVLIRRVGTGEIPGTRGQGVYLHPDGTFTYGGSIHFTTPPDFLTKEDVAAARRALEEGTSLSAGRGEPGATTS